MLLPVLWWWYHGTNKDAEQRRVLKGMSWVKHIIKESE